MSIFYDYIEVPGGAEKVSIELANKLKFPLVVAGVNGIALDSLPIPKQEIITLDKMSNIPLWKIFKAVQSFKNKSNLIHNYRNSLYSGICAPVAVHKSRAKLNYYYCHTPPRFAYDLHNFYMESLPFWQAAILKEFTKWMKKEYEPAINEMDAVFSNSKNVQARLKTYLNIDSEVVYPPINISEFYNRPQQGFYLSTARLESYKRINLIVDAFKQMPDKQLILISGGSLIHTLQKQIANCSNIKLIGWVSREELLKYMSECIATIYIPVNEDFGMSPVESMAAGKPVIGVKEGGIKETVIHLKTGYLCPPNPSKQDLIDAVQYLNEAKSKAMLNDCLERTKLYESKVFFNRMQKILHS